MKLNKLAAMAVVSIFALGIAKAGGIANFEFEKLDFTLTAMQQDQDQVQTSLRDFSGWRFLDRAHDEAAGAKSNWASLQPQTLGTGTTILGRAR